MDDEAGSSHHALVLPFGQPVHLRTRKKEAANTIDIAGRWFELAGLTVDGLDGSEPSVSVDMPQHSFPRSFDDWQIRLAVKNLFVDP